MLQSLLEKRSYEYLPAIKISRELLLLVVFDVKNLECSNRKSGKIGGKIGRCIQQSLKASEDLVNYFIKYPRINKQQQMYKQNLLKAVLLSKLLSFVWCEGSGLGKTSKCE